MPSYTLIFNSVLHTFDDCPKAYTLAYLELSDSHSIQCFSELLKNELHPEEPKGRLRDNGSQSTSQSVSLSVSHSASQLAISYHTASHCLADILTWHIRLKHSTK